MCLLPHAELHETVDRLVAKRQTDLPRLLFLQCLLGPEKPELLQLRSVCLCPGLGHCLADILGWLTVAHLLVSEEVLAVPLWLQCLVQARLYL